MLPRRGTAFPARPVFNYERSGHVILGEALRKLSGAAPMALAHEMVLQPAKPWLPGGKTTTRSVHTAPSATYCPPSKPISAIPQSNGTGRLSCLGAPRPVPLQHRANTAQMKNRLNFQLGYFWGSSHCVGGLRPNFRKRQCDMK